LCSETFDVGAYRSAIVPSRISADDNYFKFAGFDSDKFLNVTADCEISVLKDIKKYDVYFKHDNDQLIDFKQAYYHEHLSSPTDEQIYIGEFSPEKYVFKKWTNVNSGWPRIEDNTY